MANKFFNVINDAVDDALSTQYSMIDSLLRAMFYDASRNEHLIYYGLYSEFIDIVNNPETRYDENGDEYYVLNRERVDDFVKRFRDDLRENKERI